MSLLAHKLLVKNSMHTRKKSCKAIEAEALEPVDKFGIAYGSFSKIG